MASWGQDFLKGFFGSDGLRDYTHASKTFRSNGYGLSPRYKFLYHVAFTLNQAIPKLNASIPLDDQKAYSFLVKNVTMPSFDISVSEHNQYNRKRYTQNKINYGQVDINFHDDTNNIIRTLWYNYYTYYFKDPSQPYDNLSTSQGTLGTSSIISNGSTYNASDIYSPYRNGNDWGYVGESYTDGFSQINSSGKPRFIRDIRITTMSQHATATYVLINPIITKFSQSQHDYSQSSGTMDATMSIKYETVKFQQGAVGQIQSGGDNNIFGFADPARYDTRRSPLSAGSTASVLGQGGLLDTGIGIMQDLESKNVVGAIQKAGAAFRTFNNQNLGQIARDEAIQNAKRSVTNANNVQYVANRVNGVFFPTPKL